MLSVYLSNSAVISSGLDGFFGPNETMSQIMGLLENELKRHGLKIDRSSPDQSVEQILAESDTLCPAVHIGVCFCENSQDGVRIYVHKFIGTAAKLAENIHKELKSVYSFKNHEIIESEQLISGSRFYELKSTKTPAVLIEFNGNKNSKDFIDKNINRIATAISIGVLKTIKIKI